MGLELKMCPSCKEKNNASFSKCWKCGADILAGENIQGDGFVLKNFKRENSKNWRLILTILAGWILWVVVYLLFLFPLINDSLFDVGVHSILAGFHLFPMFVIPGVFVIIISKIRKIS